MARPAGLLERAAAEGRSTPGARQANDVPVDIYKGAPRQRANPDTE